MLTRFQMARRSSNSQFFDHKQAFEKALSYELPDNVFINPRWKKFMELKGVQCAVTPNMFLGPLLVATSNLMGMSQVHFLFLGMEILIILSFNSLQFLKTGR